MKIEDLKVGKSYTRGDDGDFMVIFIDPHYRFFVVLHYSHNHRVMHPLVYNQEYLDQDYNQKLKEMDDGWTIADLLEYDDIEVVDEWMLKNN